MLSLGNGWRMQKTEGFGIWTRISVQLYNKYDPDGKHERILEKWQCNVCGNANNDNKILGEIGGIKYAE